MWLTFRRYIRTFTRSSEPLRPRASRCDGPVKFLHQKTKRGLMKTFLGLALCVVILLGAYLWFSSFQENQERTAVIDSFEQPSTPRVSTTSEYRLTFHNNKTNYEAVCKPPTDDFHFCMRYSAGERHRFGTLGGTVVFYDAPDNSIPYSETKESIR
jgi:hypothetical protein